MRRKKNTISIFSGTIIMLILMLDTKTATEGTRLGIDQCLKVIIPALFPFFIITTYLNASLLGMEIPFLQSLGKLLKVPSGASSLLLLGLIGGYPMGAQLISETYHSGKLDRRSAQILLGYCNNTGPSFIFGVVGSIFTSKGILVSLWGIHLLSAIITGFMLPCPTQTKLQWDHHKSCTMVAALRKSLSSCASICGWVIVFKILITYAEQWIFRYSSDFIRVLVGGILELTNGCLSLTQLRLDALRFILCAAFLAYGGLCVLLQTMSVTDSLGLGLYIPGKIIQTAISLLLAISMTYVLFPTSRLPLTAVILLSLSAFICITISLLWSKKRYGNPK